MLHGDDGKKNLSCPAQGAFFYASPLAFGTLWAFSRLVLKGSPRDVLQILIPFYCVHAVFFSVVVHALIILCVVAAILSQNELHHTPPGVQPPTMNKQT